MPIKKTNGKNALNKSSEEKLMKQQKLKENEKSKLLFQRLGIYLRIKERLNRSFINLIIIYIYPFIN